nr:glycosyltransferase family 4 protein [bacterium]
MRVLLITDSYPPEIRSASLLMAEMAEGFRDRGCEVCVLTSSPRYNLAQWPLAGRKRLFYRETADGIEVIRTHTLPIHNVGHLRRGLGQVFLPAIFSLPTPAIRRPDATVVYSPPLTLGLAAWAVKVSRGTPFIFNVQDIFPQNAVDLGALRNPRIIAAFRAIERFVYRHADAVTVHSNANRNVLIA